MNGGSDDLKAMIRTIPDFPQPGVQFRDITTLISDATGFSLAIERLAAHVAMHRPSLIAGIEARGFIFGAAVAHRLGLGFVPVRKSRKLPGAVIGIDYALEYGLDRLEMHDGALARGERVAIIDDLIATGGTAVATANLIRMAGGEVATAAFVIDLPDLGGRDRLQAEGVVVEALMAFEGD